MDTTGWQTIQGRGVTFMLPAEYVAEAPEAGLHGSVPEYRAPGRTIALFGGLYHFSPPEPSDAVTDLVQCSYHAGRYTVNVAHYRLKRTGKYHVHAEWMLPDPSVSNGGSGSTVVRYLRAQSDNQAGQQEALIVIRTFRPEGAP